MQRRDRGNVHDKIGTHSMFQKECSPKEELNLCLYTGMPASLVKNFTMARTLSPAWVTASSAPTTGFTPRPDKSVG